MSAIGLLHSQLTFVKAEIERIESVIEKEERRLVNDRESITKLQCEVQELEEALCVLERAKKIHEG